MCAGEEKEESADSSFVPRTEEQNTSQSWIESQVRKTYKMSNYKPNPNIPEDRIITVRGCSRVFMLKAMNDQERRSAMHARLTSVFPQNTNFYPQEIKEVLISVKDREDFRTQKAFVELSTKGRTNEIVTKYWNPNNNVSRSQIGMSVRHYTKHADEEEYLDRVRIRNTKRPRDDTSPENTGEQNIPTGGYDYQAHESMYQNRRVPSSSSGSSSGPE